MIKNIVFDLDGTLWQTRDSYIYAYRKLCEKYHKTPLNGFGEVLKYMGVKVDVLLKDLFPEIIDQRELIREALLFSIEFIKKNPHDCCFNNVNNVLKELSKEYLIAADISEDGKVNYLDYVNIYNKIKELKGGAN